VKRSVGPVLAAVVIVLVATACGGASGQATLGRRAHPTTTTSTTLPNLDFLTTTTVPFVPTIVVVAKATVPMLAVYDDPGAVSPSRQLENPWVVHPDFPDQTVPQVFLVRDVRSDGWTQIVLPVRPNGSTGWVHTSDVELAATNYHVRIELGAHTITVTKGLDVLYSGPIAIGASDTPTPIGDYYVRVKIKAVDPDTVYGPYAWGLSSHSDVLETFNGGDGEIGIHGNNDASVLGQDVTHGCVRMDNDAITRLTGALPLGTPVDIVP
jgi:lipoprotein-anchoring transpeptidase ErfK/SrfK